MRSHHLRSSHVHCGAPRSRHLTETDCESCESYTSFPEEVICFWNTCSAVCISQARIRIILVNILQSIHHSWLIALCQQPTEPIKLWQHIDETSEKTIKLWQSIDETVPSFSFRSPKISKSNLTFHINLLKYKYIWLNIIDSYALRMGALVITVHCDFVLIFYSVTFLPQICSTLSVSIFSTWIQ